MELPCKWGADVIILAKLCTTVCVVDIKLIADMDWGDVNMPRPQIEASVKLLICKEMLNQQINKGYYLVSQVFSNFNLESQKTFFLLLDKFKFTLNKV